MSLPSSHTKIQWLRVQPHQDIAIGIDVTHFSKPTVLITQFPSQIINGTSRLSPLSNVHVKRTPVKSKPTSFAALVDVFIHNVSNVWVLRWRDDKYKEDILTSYNAKTQETLHSVRFKQAPLTYRQCGNWLLVVFMNDTHLYTMNPLICAQRYSTPPNPYGVGDVIDAHAIRSPTQFQGDLSAVKVAVLRDNKSTFTVMPRHGNVAPHHYTPFGRTGVVSSVMFADAGTTVVAVNTQNRVAKVIDTVSRETLKTLARGYTPVSSSLLCLSKPLVPHHTSTALAWASSRGTLHVFSLCHGNPTSRFSMFGKTVSDDPYWVSEFASWHYTWTRDDSHVRNPCGGRPSVLYLKPFVSPKTNHVDDTQYTLYMACGHLWYSVHIKLQPPI